MLQAGRLRVRFPMRPLDLFNCPNRSTRTMVLPSTQRLTEMNTRNLPGGKGWLVFRADLTAICDCLGNVEASKSHNPTGLHGLLQGHLYLFLINKKVCVLLVSGRN
jgi:hypothetical protein